MHILCNWNLVVLLLIQKLLKFNRHTPAAVTWVLSWRTLLISPYHHRLKNCAQPFPNAPRLNNTLFSQNYAYLNDNSYVFQLQRTILGNQKQRLPWCLDPRQEASQDAWREERDSSFFMAHGLWTQAQTGFQLPLHPLLWDIGAMLPKLHHCRQLSIHQLPWSP